MEQTNLMSAAKKGHRLLGIDMARTLAIYFMVMENFRNAMGGYEHTPAWLYGFFTFFAGHAAPGFVTLMGMGLVLLTQKARESADPVFKRDRIWCILRRGLFILVLGVANYQIWPGDILHFYGFYMAMCCLVLFRPAWMSLVYALLVLVVAYFLNQNLDYSLGWGGGHRWYIGYLTPRGFIRNTFFNGYHPIFPWTAYALCGMWLARQPIFERKSRRRYLLIFVPVAILLKIGLMYLYLFYRRGGGGELEGIWRYLFTRPYPAHMFLNQMVAFAVILSCLELADRFPASRIIGALATTGRHSLTHYLAHTTLVLAPMYVLHVLEQSLLTSFIITNLFMATAITFSLLYSKRYKLGPLEAVMRKIAG